MLTASRVESGAGQEEAVAEQGARTLRRPHLGPIIVAFLLVIGALVGWGQYARSVEGRYIHALAPLLFNQKIVGSALQAEAFRQPDLLPLYGSSELDSYLGPYNASELFKTYPTGFTVFPIGQDGSAALIVLQDLASVGPDLRGKKVAISISLTWFIFRDALDPDYYAGNFSRLHGGELIYNTGLSFETKQAAAKRMLDIPATLENDPLLRFSVERLADGSPPSQALYYALLPM